MVSALSAQGFDALIPSGKRVLVYTVSAGFQHEVSKRPAPDQLSLVEDQLVQLGRTTALFEAVPTTDAGAFTAENLAHFDAVFFYTTGDLPLSQPQRDALFAFVKGGGGFAGAHCAADTFPGVPEYGEMIGARFDGHPWHGAVRMKVEDPTHMAARWLDDSKGITDEIYQFAAPYDRAKLHVLMSLDTASVDMHADGIHRTDGDFALAWTKPYGKGRVFYTALGHEPKVWEDRRFRFMLAGGLMWTMRMDVRPELPEKSQSYREFASTHAGDAAKGFELFKRESGPMCARCHAVNGSGGTIGPDLSAVARRLTPEEILDSILLPSSSILAGYESVALELSDGTAVFGRITGESAGAIQLADTNAVTRSIAVKDVARRSKSRTSVMPDGLASTLSAQEFADLYAYVLTLKVPPVTSK